MSGVLGQPPERRRRGEIQLGLAVVSVVLATDQVLKWILATRNGVERTIDPVAWQASMAMASLALSVIALGYLFARKQIIAPVAGLMLGGLLSVTIDAFAGGTAEFGAFIGSVADLAVLTSVVWGSMSMVLHRLLHRDPVISAHRHLAA